MTKPEKSIKAQNLPFLTAVIVADYLVLCGALYPEILAQTSAASASWLKLVAAGALPVGVLLIASLMTPNMKAVFVFWRFRDPLPGYRAFSIYGPRDPRIDFEALRKNIGHVPTDPEQQNTIWYRLFKKVDSDAIVLSAHRHYLLFRDLSALSLLLAIATAFSLFALQVSYIWIGGTAILFVGQYLASAIAARNHGVSLVSNVLALHSLKRYG